MVCIYKITHIESGKCYIGQTSRAKRRWVEHRNYAYRKRYNGSRLYNAIKKYGAESFKFEILFNELSRDDANRKEVELIALLKSNEKEFGYNITDGGKGHNGVSGPKHYAYGMKRPDIAERNRLGKGKKLTYEHIEKVRATSTGRMHSEESKKRMSEIKKKQWDSGTYNNVVFANKYTKKSGAAWEKLNN